MSARDDTLESAAGSAREPERRGMASGWWATIRWTMVLVCLLGAGGIVALWIRAETSPKFSRAGQKVLATVCVRLPGTTILLACYQGELIGTLNTSQAPMVGKHFVPFLPLTYAEHGVPVNAHQLIMASPKWSVDWFGAPPSGPGVEINCPSWFVVGLLGAVALGVYPWRRFRARSRAA